MIFIPTAKQMRKSMLNSEKHLRQERIKELINKIKEAAAEGMDKINFHFPLDEEIISILEKKGYQVETINYTFFIISW